MIVQRDNIGIFGKVNAGKSSIMNLLTQQETSIVDAKPGTTTDSKITVQEIHGMGPIKLFDTAGIDEEGELGEKKKKKAFNDLKECDLILLVINPAADNFETEKLIINKANEYKKQLFLIYNLFDENDIKKVEDIENSVEELKKFKKMHVRANDISFRQLLIDFILNNFESKNQKTELLPFIEKDEYYILNISVNDNHRFSVSSHVAIIHSLGEHAFHLFYCIFPVFVQPSKFHVQSDYPVRYHVPCGFRRQWIVSFRSLHYLVFSIRSSVKHGAFFRISFNEVIRNIRWFYLVYRFQ